VPYGTKSPATIARYAIEDAGFLVSQGVKMLVVACNTASALARDRLREEFDVPLLSVIGLVFEQQLALHEEDLLASSLQKRQSIVAFTKREFASSPVPTSRSSHGHARCLLRSLKRVRPIRRLHGWLPEDTSSRSDQMG
jgi:hypothetical protein